MKQKSKKIKVFISSTFRDMNAERDYLVKYVFPQMELFCHELGLEFIPVDLRWGITEEESRNGLVLNACLEEVDNSRPFFIGLLGSRYGWIPEIEELGAIGSALSREQDWLLDCVIKRKSITEMEMEYGVLRDMDITHASFFIRKDSVNIPDDYREARGSEAERRLMMLKDKIRAQKKYEVNDYSTPQELGDILLRQLMKMIEEEFYADPSVAEENINYRHELSLANRTAKLCDMSAPKEVLEKWVKDNKHLLLICSAPGGGASSALAANVVKLRSMYVSKFIYFDFEALPPSSKPMDEFYKFMDDERNSRPDDKWVMVAIDNLSTLNHEDIEEIADWIYYEGEHVHVMVSVANNSDEYDILNYRFHGPILTVHGFTFDMRREILGNYMKQHGKRLTDKQMDVIVNHDMAGDATWMRLVMESVVTYGSYETLDKHIEMLLKNKDVDFFFIDIFTDYLNIYNTAGLGTEYCYAMIAISCTRSGLSESDIMAAFDISPAKWAALKPGIRRFCKGNDDRMRFIKRDWGQMVKNTWDTDFQAYVGKRLSDWYMADPERRRKGARIIADTYSNIWNLPFSWDNNEKQNYAEYKESIKQFAVSKDAVDNVSPSTLLFLLHNLLLLKEKDFLHTSNSLYANALNGLTLKEKIDYYERIGKTLSAYNYNLQASRCYGFAGELLKANGNPKSTFYLTLALLEIGRAELALGVIDESGFLPKTGFSKWFGKKQNDKSPNDQIMATIIKSEACRLLGRNYEMQKLTAKLIDDMDNFDTSNQETARKLAEILCTQLMKNIYFLIIFGDQSCAKFASEAINQVYSEYTRFGLTSDVAYYLLMNVSLLKMYVSDMQGVQYYSYYAMRSASFTHGYSYRYGRAGLLYTLAVTKITGKNPKPWNTITKTGFITPPYRLRTVNGVAPESIDPDVRKTMDIENQWYEKIIASIPKE